MPRTVTDEQWAKIEEQMQVNRFIESIYNDPALNKEAKRLIKKKYPNMQIPDLDIEDRVEARFAEEKRLKEEAESAARQQAEQENWQSKRKETQDRYGFTDEGMSELEQMMVERNIGDYDVAASYKVQRDPRPSAADFNTGRWNHEKAPGFAEIAKDPEGWGRSEILKAIYSDQDRERGRR